MLTAWEPSSLRSDNMSFTNLKELIELAEQEKTPISELMIKTEVQQKGCSRKRLSTKCRNNLL